MVSMTPVTYNAVSYTPQAISPLERALASVDYSAGGKASLPALPLAQIGPLTKKLTEADLREDMRAYLASIALTNASSLSNMAAHLYRVAPWDYHCYKAVIEAYTVGAVQAIAKM